MSVIFVKITKYLLPIVIFFRLLGVKIYYLRLSESLQQSDSSWIMTLKQKNIIPLQIENLPEIIGFSKGYADNEMNIYNKTREYASEKLLMSFIKLFPDNKDITKRLRIFIHQMLSSQAMTISNIINIWARAYPDEKHILFDIHFSGFYTSGLDSNIKLIVLPCDFLANGMMQMFKTMRRYNLTSKKNHDINSIIKNMEEPKIIQYKPRIALITHKGTTYGDLFQKDLFYSNKIESELFPENLLHFDYSGYSSPSDKIHWVRIGNHRSLWADNIKYAFFAILNGIIHIRDLKHIIGLYFVTRTYIIFQSFLHQLKYFPELKIILIDYEILCPKELIMASEAVGIQSIASTERFILSFNNNVSVLLTHYLCGSPYTAKLMIKSPLYCVEKFIPVGLHRSDILINSQNGNPPTILNEPISQGLKIVTALGFHTVLSWHESQAHPLLNWTAHQHFLDDMCRLAEDISDIFIILRYKNVDWMELPVFEESVKKIMASDNMTISTDYSKSYISYDLCAHSDLVIAKHTSLADECLSVGIPVLFHEYTHNLERIVADAFDYSPAKIMCYNYEELLERARIVLNGSPNELSRGYDYLQKVIYGSLGDGKVKERMHQLIENILEN